MADSSQTLVLGLSLGWVSSNSQVFSPSGRTLSWRLLQTMRSGSNSIHHYNLYSKLAEVITVTWAALSMSISGISRIQPFSEGSHGLLLCKLTQGTVKSQVLAQSLKEWRSKTSPLLGPSAPVLLQENSGDLDDWQHPPDSSSTCFYFYLLVIVFWEGEGLACGLSLSILAEPRSELKVTVSTRSTLYLPLPSKEVVFCFHFLHYNVD